MIWDTLANAALYRQLHPGFDLAFDWLAKLDPNAPEGRMEINGDRIFALVQGYTTKPASEMRFETHVERIDIQYVMRGAEIMLCTPRAGLKVSHPYDAKKDILFYDDPNPSLIASPVVSAGLFTVFFPTDAHKPMCQFQAAAPVKKVVVKIRTAK